MVARKLRGSRRCKCGQPLAGARAMALRRIPLGVRTSEPAAAVRREDFHGSMAANRTGAFGRYRALPRHPVAPPPESLSPRVGPAQALIPQNRREAVLALLLSLKAAFSEEIFFRLALPLLLFRVTGSLTVSHHRTDRLRRRLSSAAIRLRCCRQNSRYLQPKWDHLCWLHCAWPRPRIAGCCEYP